MTAVGIMASAVVPVTVVETFPEIVTTNTEVGNSLGAANPIPAPSGVTVGDLLVAICTSDNPAGTAITPSAGWTEIIQITHGTTTNRVAAFGRVATGSDALSLSGAAQDYCAAILRINSHSVTNVATDIKSAGVNSSAGSVNPDPPSLNAGSSRKWLWLAVVGVDTIGTLTWSAVPTGYTQAISPLQSANTASSCSMGIASRQNQVQTEDPATFTIGAANQHQTLTIAIPPATS